MGPNDKFDLLIKGGDVLDPSRGLRGVRDIGTRNGVIESVEVNIPAERALKVLTVTGRLVTPGLIDLHAHTFPYGSAIGIPADELVPFQGTTTAVSAGDAGANNLAAYRRFIMGSTRTRLYAFVHIANIGLTGFPVAELYNIDFAQPEIAARALAENAEFVLGVKVRMSENVIAKHGIEPLRRAIRACDLSGVAGAKGHVPHRRRRERRANVRDPADAAPARHPHALLLGGTESRRSVHQYRAGRKAAARGAGCEEARRLFRRWTRWRQLRLHRC